MIIKIYIFSDISAVASNLCKIAFNFLSLSPSTSVSINNSSEETYIVSQIRQYLSQQSREKKEQFEILYNKICESVSTYIYYFLINSNNIKYIMDIGL